jgi:acyl-CoA synthetase (AMP-forming)/AMP-acid ligase II
MANTDAMGFWKIAEADPGHIAVIDPDHQVMTYGELYALTNQIVHGLRALGLSGAIRSPRCCPTASNRWRSRSPRSRVASTTRRSTGISSARDRVHRQ